MTRHRDVLAPAADFCDWEGLETFQCSVLLVVGSDTGGGRRPWSLADKDLLVISAGEFLNMFGTFGLIMQLDMCVQSGFSINIQAHSKH